MPEYLAPGVYVEEVSFRQKSIEGVSTSTAGFIGPARFGPVYGPPPLLTSFLDFERVFGGLDQLSYEGALTDNYLAHAVRAFFENGGRRLYVTRAYSGPAQRWANHSLAPLGSPADVVLRARYPGRAGDFRVLFDFRVGPSALGASAGVPILRGVLPGDTVLVRRGGMLPGVALSWLEPWFDEGLGVDTYRLRRLDPDSVEADAPLVSRLDQELLPVSDVRVVTVSVTIGGLGRFISPQFWEGLGFHPVTTPGSRSSVMSLFAADPLNRSAALNVPLAIDSDLGNGVAVLEALLESVVAEDETSPPASDAASLLDHYLVDFAGRAPRPVQLVRRLAGGSDGSKPGTAAYEGDTDREGNKSGLLAFEDVDDISIVAAPGSTSTAITGSPLESASVQQLLIGHCERMRYRIGVLDSPPRTLVGDIRQYRGRMDSRHAALYYPWVTIIDSVTEREITVPPSGFLAGIYARNDVDRGVHKSPANEVVRLAVDYEFRLNTAQQDVLNPEGVNCLRFFEGRGFRVWGARTIASDPEWKYVALRRFFAFLEHSIDKGTQWAVFEPNGRILWDNVRRTVEDFLFAEWKAGHLLGDKPEEAFFVKCDLSTMTQNDLDNGRLVCLVGVAPLRPAEFVIFRIGQMTLTARI
jgi:uncharacterized protein